MYFLEKYAVFQGCRDPLERGTLALVENIEGRGYRTHWQLRSSKIDQIRKYDFKSL